MINLRTLTIPAVLVLAGSSWAGMAEDMDYGRFLTATYLTPEYKTPDGATVNGKSTLETKIGCATNKGIAVKLGNREGGAIFDTDLCRLSGGWTGGYLKYKGVAFD